ncbi:calcium-binding protein [Streptomyces sp. NPDC046977]|uniref:calcium-binding protein n=1 Tax=Streptomyces sp. NPDC046977 TaxID=3154703 RepID=UPI0033DCEF07
MHKRIRAAAVVGVGALALSALALPAAQAAPAAGDTNLYNVSVNDGKPIVIGSSGIASSVTVKMTAFDRNGLNDISGILYHGTDVNHHDWGVSLPSCGKHAVTTYTCTIVLKSTDVYRHFGVNKNSQAGSWKMWGYALGADGDSIQKDPAKTFSVLRGTKLTVNAAPEPVKKGKTITITGTLKQANWESHLDVGHSNQFVALQFRKAGTTKYVDVKGTRSSVSGYLKTTVHAAADGYYRFAYKGTPTAAPVVTAGDYIDVR